MMQKSQLVITASAGTGKTHQLSNRYLKLLLAQGDTLRLERILATTFTRKAAGEIFDRIVQRLVDALSTPLGLETLAHNLDCESIDRAQCMSMLRGFTRQLHRVRVLTLDAFFAELALNFSMELPLPANWRIADDSLGASVQNLAIERMLFQLGAEASVRLVHDLAQGELKRDVDNLIQQLVTELFDLYRAANEAGDRAWNWLPPIASYPDVDRDPFLSNFESMFRDLDCGKQVRRALASVNEMIQSNDFKRIAESTLVSNARFTGKYGHALLPSAVVEALNTVANHAANALHWQLGRQNEAIHRLLNEYLKQYRAVCQELRVAFFSDVTYALRQFDQLAHALAYRLDARIDHLLLDEFQDTSADQWQILKPIAKRILERPDQPLGKAASFFCVGDIKQAIYGFRHGSSEILEQLADQLTSERMTENRRSLPAVITMVNQIFRHLNRHPICDAPRNDQHDDQVDSVDCATAASVETWVNEFPEHDACEEIRNGSLRGYACLRSAGRYDEEEDEGGALDVTLQEAANVVKQMRDAEAGYGIGVLVRTNDGVTRMIHKLHQLGINASEIGGNPLTNSAPIRLILSALRVADHSSHSAAWFHVANSPLGSELDFPDPNHFDVNHARDFSRRMRTDLLRGGYGVTIAALANRLSPHCTPQQQKRLQQLVDLAYAYQSRSTPRPDDFVSFVSATRVADPMAADVQVLTIHQAKGLEFDRVVVTELDKPSMRIKYAYQRDSKSHAPSRIAAYISKKAHHLLSPDLRSVYFDHQYRLQREELCVMYVALTRARYELQIVVAPSKETTSPRNFPKNAAGLIRAALCDSAALEPYSIAHAVGDPKWYLGNRRGANDGLAAGEIANATVTRGNIQFAAADSGARTSRPSVSPSQLEGQPRIPVAELFQASRNDSLRLGTLVHGWFESIEWLNEEQWPDADKLRHVAIQLGTMATNQQIDKFLGTIAQPNVRNLLTLSSYRSTAQTWLAKFGLNRDARFDVRNEQAIVFDDSQQILTGFVDRLILVWSEDRVVAADVIDYKTDHVDSAEGLAARGEYYAPQLAAYRRALAGMLRITTDRIRTRLLFTAADVVFELEK